MRGCASTPAPQCWNELAGPTTTRGLCRPERCWNLLARVLQRGEGIGSIREVNRLIGRLFGERRPPVDLSHCDLARGEERPEQHGGGFRRGQHGLGFDPVASAEVVEIWCP